ncbi:response regulator transcription factor [Chloroflexota bacterium]
MLGKILIIEDDPVLRRDIASIFTEANYQTVQTADCLEALMTLEEYEPDLVVLDEKVPVIDGWETAHLLNHAYGLPVMIIGSNPGRDTWIKVLEVGADFYLKIPFGHQELTGRVKAILRRYHQKQAVPVN